MESDFTINACRLIKRGLFMSCRYPAFSSEFIREKIDRPTTEASELRDYQANNVRSKRIQATFFVLLLITYSLKNLFLVYESFRLFDYERCERNIRPAPFNQLELQQMQYFQPGGTLTRVSCLLTNCSRLRPLPASSGGPSRALGSPLPVPLTAQTQTQARARLAEDASKLPLFLMCNPILDRLYTPVEKLDAFGILAFLVSMYTVFLLGSWTTIQQSLLPASNDTIMFVTSPQVTARLVRQRAWQIVCDLAISYHNYRIDSIWKFTNANFNGQLLQQQQRRQQQQQRQQVGGSASRTERQHGRALDATIELHTGPTDRARTGLMHERADRNLAQLLGDPVDSQREAAADFVASRDRLVESILLNSCLKDRSQEQVSAIIDSCMPLVRTAWWRPRLARLFLKTLSMSLLFIFSTGLLSFSYIQYRLIQKRQLLADYAREMDQMNCFIWSDRSDSLEVARSIKVAELNLDWSLYAILETALLNYLAGFSIAFMFTYYWAIVCEIGVWLAELRMFIVASLLVTRFNYDHARRQAETSRLADQQAHKHWTAAMSSADFESDTERPHWEDQFEGGGTGRGSPSRSYWRHHFISTRHFYKVANLRRLFQESTMQIQLLFVQRIERRDKWTQNSITMASPNYTGPGHKSTMQHKQPRQFDYHRLGSEQNDRCFARRFLAEILFPLSEYDAQHDETPSRAREPRDHADERPAAQQFDQTDYDIETLEQIYINFRLLVEYIHSLGPSMTVVMAITYLLSYGYVLVAVLCERKIANFTEEPLFVMIFGFTIANYIIFLSADFHAKSKKVQPLLWSIIAQLTHSKNLRVRHLRSLWLRQVLILDNEGGLALSALGMRITYVNIIQSPKGVLAVTLALGSLLALVYLFFIKSFSSDTTKAKRASSKSVASPKKQASSPSKSIKSSPTKKATSNSAKKEVSKSPAANKSSTDKKSDSKQAAATTAKTAKTTRQSDRVSGSQKSIQKDEGEWITVNKKKPRANKKASSPDQTAAPQTRSSTRRSTQASSRT